jgi:hypothetical protein
MLIQLTYASRTFCVFTPADLASILKYSRSASFDPYGMGSDMLQAFFNELLANGEWIV